MKALPTISGEALVYLDPPYYVKGEGLYDSCYVQDDHLKLAKIVKDEITKQKWIVSYDDVSQIRELYKGYRQLAYKLNYSAADRYKGSEIIFFCDNLIIPQTDSPLHQNIHRRTRSRLLNITLSLGIMPELSRKFIIRTLLEV